MSNIFEYHASDSVQLKLADFEGPIALLYRLIVVEGKFDIETYPLAQITGQYLQYMKQIDTVDIDVASDFVEVASTLVEIKSKRVLPRLEEEQPIEDESDPEAILRYRMMMYAMMKEQGQKLALQEQKNKFYRQPKFTNDDAILIIKNFDFGKMIDSYGQMLIRFGDSEDKMPIKKVVKDRFTVKDKIKFLSKAIISKKKFVFNSMFEKDITRGEIISTFQALLELMKHQLVVAIQENFNSDIIVQLSDEYQENSQLFEKLLTEGEFGNE